MRRIHFAQVDLQQLRGHNNYSDRQKIELKTKSQIEGVAFHPLQACNNALLRSISCYIFSMQSSQTLLYIWCNMQSQGSSPIFGASNFYDVCSPNQLNLDLMPTSNKFLSRWIGFFWCFFPFSVVFPLLNNRSRRRTHAKHVLWHSPCLPSCHISFLSNLKLINFSKTKVFDSGITISWLKLKIRV